jgi:hypothetical protein
MLAAIERMMLRTSDGNNHANLSMSLWQVMVSLRMAEGRVAADLTGRKNVQKEVGT